MIVRAAIVVHFEYISHFDHVIDLQIHDCNKLLSDCFVFLRKEELLALFCNSFDSLQAQPVHSLTKLRDEVGACSLCAMQDHFVKRLKK